MSSIVRSRCIILCIATLLAGNACEQRSSSNPLAPGPTMPAEILMAGFGVYMPVGNAPTIFEITSSRRFSGRGKIKIELSYKPQGAEANLYIYKSRSDAESCRNSHICSDNYIKADTSVNNPKTLFLDVDDITLFTCTAVTANTGSTDVASGFLGFYFIPAS